MNIGYIHIDNYPLNHSHSVLSWQICTALKKRHNVYVTHTTPFPGFSNKYNSIKNILKFINNIDVLFIMIDGQFYFYTEKFSIFSLLKIPKIPVVWFINAPIQEEKLLPWIDKRVIHYHLLQRKIFAKFVDLGMCVSYNVEKLVKKELGIRKTIVIPNGGDAILFNPVTAGHSVLNQMNRFIVMWHGDGAYPWHGLDLIIQCAKYLENIDPSILFVIMTNNPWIADYSQKNILYLKAVNYFDLPSYINDADIALCLYHPQFGNVLYNSPMKLFDYMSMGKIVIASKYGQFNEIIHHMENGIIVSNSVKEICKMILKIKHFSPKIRNHIQLSARNTIQNQYNWKISCEAIEKELVRLVQR